MNMKSTGTKVFLALAGAVWLVPASSQAALVYADGDVLLGFRATGGTGGSTSYLVNLGNITQFLAADSSNTVLTLDSEIGNIGADLVANYGGSWNTRVDVLWSTTGVQKIGGGGLASNTILASRSSYVGYQASAPWVSPSAFGAGAPAGKLQSEAQKYLAGTDGSGQTESTNSLYALIQPNSVANDHRSFQPGGENTTGLSAYGYFNDAYGVESNFGNGGVGGTALDFYVLQPGSGNGDFIGQFTISNTGTVTFTPDGVPEPASFLAFGVGTLALASTRRRQTIR